jgi:hypothetical protein
MKTISQDIEKQKEAYRLRFAAFLADALEPNQDLKNYIKESYDSLGNDDRAEIDTQIQEYKKRVRRNTGLSGVGRQIIKNIFGPLGISGSAVEDLFTFKSKNGVSAKDIRRNAAQSILDNKRSSIKRALNQSIRSKIPSTSSITNRLLSPNRSGRRDVNNNPLNARSTQELKQELAGQIIQSKDPRDVQNLDKFHSTVFSSTQQGGKTSNKDDIIERYINNNFIVFTILNVPSTPEYLIFPMANFTALTDSANVTQTAVQYIGKPEALYQYSGTSRTVSFTFDTPIFPQETGIHNSKLVYDKINTLKSFQYENRINNDGFIQPHILKLSIGNYMNEVPFYLTSLAITGDDDVYHYEGRPSNLTITISGNITRDLPRARGVNMLGTNEPLIGISRKRINPETLKPQFAANPPGEKILELEKQERNILNQLSQQDQAIESQRQELFLDQLDEGINTRQARFNREKIWQDFVRTKQL